MNDKLPTTVATYPLDAHWRAELKSNGDVVIITDNHVECVLSAKRAHNLLRLLFEHRVDIYRQAYPGDQGVEAWQRAKPSVDAWLAAQPEMLEIRVYAPAWPYLESLLFACPSLFFEYEAHNPDMPEAVRQYSVPTREVGLVASNLIDWLEHSDGHTETRFYDRLRPIPALPEDV